MTLELNSLLGTLDSVEDSRAVGVGTACQVRFPLEPGVGVEPTSAIHSWMLTTGCYEMFLQPVA